LNPARPQWFNPTAYAEKVDTVVVVPVFGGIEDDAAIVGHYFAIVPWVVYFLDELVAGTDPVHAVIDSSCGHTFAFVIEGRNATFLGEGYTADAYGYESVSVSAPFAEFASDSCIYTLTVYPTSTYEDFYTSNDPIYYMLFIVGVFGLAAASFYTFDCLLRKRQVALVATTTRQHALVSSLFPKSVQKQLLEDMDNDGKWNKSGMAGLRNFLKETGGGTDLPEEPSKWVEGGKSKPIADLFPDVTIMFADISGFTGKSRNVALRLRMCSLCTR
jgi:hypothetical protein